MDSFRQAVNYDGDNPVFLRGLGTALSARGDFAQAERYLASALRYDPAHAVTNYNMALVKLNLEKYGDALPLCHQGGGTATRFSSLRLHPGRGL